MESLALTTRALAVPASALGDVPNAAPRPTPAPPTPNPRAAAPAHPAAWDRLAVGDGFAEFILDGALGQWIRPAAHPSVDFVDGQHVARLQWAGTAAEQAIEAARAVARRPVEGRFQDSDGNFAVQTFNPAVAVLHDAHTGYWIGALETTVEYDDVDMHIAHAIDGPSVGAEIELIDVVPRTDALHYVVGRDQTISFVARPSEKN